MEDAAGGAAHRAADQEGSAEDAAGGPASLAADNGGSAALAEDAVGSVEQAGRSADNGGSAADGAAHRAADQEGSVGSGTGGAVEDDGEGSADAPDVEDAAGRAAHVCCAADNNREGSAGSGCDA